MEFSRRKNSFERDSEDYKTYDALEAEAKRRAEDSKRKEAPAIVFKMVPGGAWLVGVGDDVRATPGTLRGLLPAYAALSQAKSNGSAKLSDFLFDDEKAAADAIRTSIHGACAKWAKKAGCIGLEMAFIDIDVEEAKGLITYKGSRRFITD